MSAGTFCHWLVYDFPQHVHNLAQGLKPGSVGVSGTDHLGRPGYGAPRFRRSYQITQPIPV